MYVQTWTQHKFLCRNQTIH